MPLDKYSHGLRRRVAEEAAKSSFDETVASVAKTTGGHVPKRQAEEMVVAVAQDFEAFYRTREITGPEDTGDPLIMSLDGKGIVMRRESLRTATRKAAERERHKMKTRLSAGEKRHRKRMATVATVYSIEPYPRTAEAIMGREEMTENTSKPRPRNKRVWASVQREAQAVTEEVRSLAPRSQTTAALGDARRRPASAAGADQDLRYPSWRRGDPYSRFHPRPRIPLERGLLLPCQRP